MVRDAAGRELQQIADADTAERAAVADLGQELASASDAVRAALQQVRLERIENAVPAGAARPEQRLHVGSVGVAVHRFRVQTELAGDGIDAPNPRTKGDRLPNLATLARTQIGWRTDTVTRYGKTDTIHILTINCLTHRRATQPLAPRQNPPHRQRHARQTAPHHHRRTMALDSADRGRLGPSPPGVPALLTAQRTPGRRST